MILPRGGLTQTQGTPTRWECSTSQANTSISYDRRRPEEHGSPSLGKDLERGGGIYGGTTPCWAIVRKHAPEERVNQLPASCDRPFESEWPT